MKKFKTLQNRIRNWMLDCFNWTIANDTNERNHRFLEESLELVQSLGCTKEEVILLVEYVYNRPLGEPFQEVGGVMVTLAALCNCNNIDMRSASETETFRIESPEIMDKIRRKQANKPHSSPLPQ